MWGHLSRRTWSAITRRWRRVVGDGALPSGPLDADPDTRDLYRLFNTLQPPSAENGVVLQFLSTGEVARGSAISRAFAQTAAQSLSGDVLLLDLATPGSDHYTALLEDQRRERGRRRLSSMFPAPVGVDGGKLWMQAGARSGLMSLHRMTLTGLYVTRFEAGFDPAQAALTTRSRFWAEVRARFSLIVVDSAFTGPLSQGVDAARVADAVVMLVERDRDRRRTVEAASQEVARAEGHLSGVVLTETALS